MGDAVVEQFELADGVEYNHADGRVTVAGPAPADVSRFDHPIVSLFGVALARSEGAAIERAAVNPADERFTLTWDAD